MVSFFLAFCDQDSIIKDSNVFEFTNFPFKTKYHNAVVYSGNNNCLFTRGKQEKKLLKQSTAYLLIFHKKSIIFEGSPNSTESYFLGKLRLGES